jgi:putative ABC transport system substrate-binding protein
MGMRRREFIAALSGAAATWPLSVGAQHTAMPIVGFLRSTSLAPFANLVPAFRLGLKEAGFVEGQNVAIEYRYAENQTDRLPGLVTDLIDRSVTVIVANSPAAVVAKASATTVPIVFVTGGDPIRDGLVVSLNRPGGSVTGVSFFSDILGAKRLELLRRLVPNATSIALLAGPPSPDTVAEQKDVQAAAVAIGQQLISIEVNSDHDIETAFATFNQRGAGALVAVGGAFLSSRRERIVALSARYALPTSYALREFVLDGGLMSYGTSLTDAYRQAGIYAGRILKGEKPADLPVMRSVKFEFVLNLKTAKALGLEVQPTLLAIADEVIE